MSKDDLNPGTAPLHVMLAYSPLGLVHAVATELHNDGMVIDTGAIALDEHAEVEVSFTRKHNGQFLTQRVSARVITSSGGSAHLLFGSYSREIQTTTRVATKGDRCNEQTGFPQARTKKATPNPWRTLPLGLLPPPTGRP